MRTLLLVLVCLGAACAAIYSPAYNRGWDSSIPKSFIYGAHRYVLEQHPELDSIRPEHKREWRTFSVALAGRMESVTVWERNPREAARSAVNFALWHDRDTVGVLAVFEVIKLRCPDETWVTP